MCIRLVPRFSGIQPSQATVSHIEREIAADLRPVHPIASRQLIFGDLIAIFACVVAAAVYRMGAFALAAMGRLQAAGILGALAICTGLLALSLVQQMSPGSRHWISPRLLPIGILGALAVLISALFQFQPEPDSWVRAWTCLRAGIPPGAIAATLFWLVLRRATVLSPTMTGAAGGCSRDWWAPVVWRSTARTWTFRTSWWGTWELRSCAAGPGLPSDSSPRLASSAERKIVAARATLP